MVPCEEEVSSTVAQLWDSRLASTVLQTACNYCTSVRNWSWFGVLVGHGQKLLLAAMCMSPQLEISAEQEMGCFCRSSLALPSRVSSARCGVE